MPKGPWDFPDGMTVAELQQRIMSWPTKHQDGTPTRVLVSGEPVTQTIPTNWQQDDGKPWTADIWLSNRRAELAEDLFCEVNKDE